MTRQIFQQLVRDHRESFVGTPAQHAAFRAMARCGTAEAGTHTLTCTDCGHQITRYNSCRNRHCPCCQGAEQARWVAAREAELLPITYFHAVLTVPHDLLPYFRAEPRLCYDALLQAARQAVDDCCRNPKLLGAEVGQIQVLHTWGSDLKLHPHVHTIVTGGGIAPDGTWVDAKPVGKKHQKCGAFLISVRVLRARFRTLLMDRFKPIMLAHHAEEVAVGLRAWAALRREKWSIHLKEPFGTPEIALRYLGRYTHRVAMSPSRLSSYDGTEVTLAYKDYRHGGRPATVRLPAEDLLQRLSQHILPRGLRRIRMSGLLAPRVRQSRLERARQLLAGRNRPSINPPTRLDPAVTLEPRTCPHCRKRMVVTEVSRPLPYGGVQRMVTAAGVALWGLRESPSPCAVDGPTDICHPRMICA